VRCLTRRAESARHQRGGGHSQVSGNIHCAIYFFAEIFIVRL
jgi:hypothetical protein